jgi:hypothetical protein
MITEGSDTRRGITHFAVLLTGLDPTTGEMDPDDSGRLPAIRLIAAGCEDHCWGVLNRWTAEHPLGARQAVEVVTRGWVPGVAP